LKFIKNSINIRFLGIVANKHQILKVLNKHGYSYGSNGKLINLGVNKVALTLEQLIINHDWRGVKAEFERVFNNLELDSPASLNAACSMLESMLKIYIKERKLEMPSKMTVKNLWKMVSKHADLAPKPEMSEDFNKILSGLTSIVDGAAVLRTHESSAHGQGHKNYKVEVRHARFIRCLIFCLFTT
jgi:hypothetical protein